MRTLEGQQQHGELQAPGQQPCFCWKLPQVGWITTPI